MIEVRDQPFDQQRGELDLTDHRVTAAAEQAAYVAGRVVVVDDQFALSRVAEQAPTALCGAHLRNLSRGQSVLATQPGAEVLLPGRLRIGPTPRPQPFVPPLPVGRAILPIPHARAVAALAAFLAPLAELVRAKGPLAGSARKVHTSILAWLRGIVERLDQPCHADVLLEVANS